jgi:hypothetical protein
MAVPIFLYTISLRKPQDVISWIRKSKKDRQYNDQTKKNKRTNNDLQNNTQKTKDRATRIDQQKPWVNSGAPEG